MNKNITNKLFLHPIAEENEKKYKFLIKLYLLIIIVKIMLVKIRKMKDIIKHW